MAGSSKGSRTTAEVVKPDTGAVKGGRSGKCELLFTIQFGNFFWQARDSQLKEQYEIMVTQSQSIVERNNEAGHEAQYLLGQLEVQGETIAWQADTMSWFTLITFIFLPLAFFTQVRRNHQSPLTILTCFG